ncbi:MAG: PIN domain-containing protein, partial [Xenococcaceae cyanobacterium]
MSHPTGVLLLFEPTALLAGRTREWREYSQVGSCYVPQVVMEQMEFLCARSPDPEQESTAREFRRFISDSNWLSTIAQATHPKLSSSPGQELSQTARLQLAYARCAYGFSQENLEQLVVVVSNSQNLRSQIENLEVNNLCAISVNNLLQWARTHQRPLNVTQKMHRMSQTPHSEYIFNSPPVGTSPTPPSSGKTPSSASRSIPRPYRSSSQSRTRILSQLIS